MHDVMITGLVVTGIATGLLVLSPVLYIWVMRRLDKKSD